MALFTEVDARYFFSTVPTAGTNASFRDYVNGLPLGQVVEGTPEFDRLRHLAHREVERLLLLAASHFRRAHDLLSAIASPWALVTLYYGSFFGAGALLGSLGAWRLKGGRVLEVIHSAQGTQRLQVYKVHSSYKGSHEQFWEYYFSHAKALLPSASPVERFALQAIANDITWLTDKRNEVNYDSFKAVEQAIAHRAGFSTASFPGSLPGNLSTMFRFAEALLRTTNRVTKAIRINSDAVSTLTTLASRSSRVRALVLSERLPALGRKAARPVVCGD